MKGPGYDAANPITPYIHVMVYHCPTLLRRYGNIKMFTGQGNTTFLVLYNRTAKLWNQINNIPFFSSTNSWKIWNKLWWQIFPLFIFLPAGVEKKNDDVRRNFHRKINRWDPCASLLTVEKQQEDLLQSQREKCSYTKANAQHWEEGGGGGGEEQRYKKIPPNFYLITQS